MFSCISLCQCGWLSVLPTCLLAFVSVYIHNVLLLYSGACVCQSVTPQLFRSIIFNRMLTWYMKFIFGFISVLLSVSWVVVFFNVMLYFSIILCPKLTVTYSHCAFFATFQKSVVNGKTCRQTGT